MRKLRCLIVALALAAPLVGPQAALPQQHDQGVRHQRLILKDGSYQLVTHYEIHGDRVRYLSAEREGQWEEIPYDLVDWPATETWNKEHNAAANSGNDRNNGQSEAAEIDREERAQREDARARMPEIAPGLKLPDEDGVFALDQFDGLSELLHMQQSGGDVNRNPYHGVHRVPLQSMTGAREVISLYGPHAPLQLHLSTPAFYVRISGAPEAPAEDAFTVDTSGAKQLDAEAAGGSPDSHYAFLLTDQRQQSRTVGALEISKLSAAAQSEEITPATTEVLPGKHWMKVTPRYPLEPGEYALVELLPQVQVNLDVWDFGINPKARENPHPILPIHPDAR